MGRQGTRDREGWRGWKKTKITKACVCLSLVFSTLLHKIPPSLFSIPSSVSLSSSLLPVIGQLVGSTKPQTYYRLIQVAQSPLRQRREAGKESSSVTASISHIGAVRVSRGGGRWLAASLLLNSSWSSLIDSLCSLRLSSNMSSSSANLRSKRLPCESFLKLLKLLQKIIFLVWVDILRCSCKFAPLTQFLFFRCRAGL